MVDLFAATRKKRGETRGDSQKLLGPQPFAGHSAAARRENADRLPDAAGILRLAKRLGADANEPE